MGKVNEVAGVTISRSLFGRVTLSLIMLVVAIFIAFPARRERPLNADTGMITPSSPVEARLAALDQDSTSIINGSDGPYRRILFILAPKCTEDADALAQIAISAREAIEIDHSRTISTLQLLHVVSRAAPSGLPRRSCRELFDAVVRRGI
jgi:hypothetical protein